MSAVRKKQLRKRKDKQSRHDAKRREPFDRMLEVLGLKGVLGRMPSCTIDLFLRKMGPPMEVVVERKSSSNKDFQDLVSSIVPLIRRPLRGEINGRRFVLAIDDFFRCHRCIDEGISFFHGNLQRQGDPSFKWFFAIFEDAKATLESLDHAWFVTVLGAVLHQVIGPIEERFRVNGPIVETRLTLWDESGRHLRPRLEIRLNEPEPRYVNTQGTRRLTYVCRDSDPWEGVRRVVWNPRRLGIDGPDRDQPVLISEHAIKRLEERLPLPGYKWTLHLGMAQSLAQPVFSAGEEGARLVEYRLKENRLGYLVAEVHAGFVLIKTFLFLTMSGTPESRLLRDKLGIARADVEHYRLDNIFTLVGSDIVKDRLLQRVLSECGCGHLLNLLDLEYRTPWLEVLGKQFTKTFDIREDARGFIAGQKWNRWTHE